MVLTNGFAGSALELVVSGGAAVNGCEGLAVISYWLMVISYSLFVKQPEAGHRERKKVRT